jgi:hypothetical protein
MWDVIKLSGRQILWPSILVASILLNGEEIERPQDRSAMISNYMSLEYMSITKVQLIIFHNAIVN